MSECFHSILSWEKHLPLPLVVYRAWSRENVSSARRRGFTGKVCIERTPPDDARDYWLMTVERERSS